MTIEPIISTFVILYSISIGILLPAYAYPTGAGGCFSSDAVDDASMFAFHHGGPLYQTSAGHGDYSLKASSQTYIPGCSYTLGLCGNMQFTGYLLYAYEKGQPAKRFGILSANELNSRSHTLNCENTQATITHSDGNLKNPNVHFTFSSQPSSNYNSTILPPSQIDFTIYVMKSNMADWYTFKTSLVLDSNWQSSQCINPPNVVCPVTKILFDPTVASASNSMANMPGMDGMDMTNSQQSTSMDMTHDHSGSDNSSMNDMPMDQMTMTHTSAFNTNWSSQTILFHNLKTSDPGYYIFALMIIFVLAILHEVLGIIQLKFDERIYNVKKAQLDRQLIQDARVSNDQQFVEKRQRRAQQERDQEINRKLAIANTEAIHQNNHSPLHCQNSSQSLELNGKDRWNVGVQNIMLNTNDSALSPIVVTSKQSNNQHSTYQQIKSKSNSDAPRTNECEEHSHNDVSNGEASNDASILTIESEPTISKSERQITGASQNTLIDKIEFKTNDDGNLLIENNQPINDSNSSSNDDKMKSNIEFASEHLRQAQPLHCQTQITTISTPLNGSSILTLSTSSCAAPPLLMFRYSPHEQMYRTTFYLIRTFLMMILMVLFMTLDVGIVIVILAGTGIGYFFYSNNSLTDRTQRKSHH